MAIPVEETSGNEFLPIVIPVTKTKEQTPAPLVLPGLAIEQ